MSAEDIIGFRRRIKNVPIQYGIRGQRLSCVQRYSKQIVAGCTKLPRIVDVEYVVWKSALARFKVYIDRDRAADLGMATWQPLPRPINLLVSGGLDIARYKDEIKGKRYDIRVRLNQQDQGKVLAYAAHFCTRPYWKLVERLANVVKVEEGTGTALSAALTGKGPRLPYVPSLGRENPGTGKDELVHCRRKFCLLINCPNIREARIP